MTVEDDGRDGLLTGQRQTVTFIIPPVRAAESGYLMKQEPLTSDWPAHQPQQSPLPSYTKVSSTELRSGYYQASIQLEWHFEESFTLVRASIYTSPPLMPSLCHLRHNAGSRKC